VSSLVGAQHITDRKKIHELIFRRGPANIGIFAILADSGGPQRQHVDVAAHNGRARHCLAPEEPHLRLGKRGDRLRDGASVTCELII
jgi:hypothetical protein